MLPYNLQDINFMDESIFKVYRNVDSEEVFTTGKIYSLGQILNLGNAFLNEKIFQIELKNNSGFKYAVMKMNKIQGKEKKTLV